MHGLLVQLLSEKDTSRAAALFDLKDDEIESDLEELYKRIEEIADADEYEKNENDQNVVDLCMGRITAAIGASVKIEGHAAYLVSLLSLCLRHNLAQQKKGKDPPHAKIASSVMNLLLSGTQCCSAKVMSLAIPVVFRFLECKNRELVENAVNYLTLASLSTPYLLASQMTLVLEVLLKGNCNLAQLLLQIYDQNPGPVLEHVDRLVELVDSCGLGDKLSFIQIFWKVAKTHPKLLEKHVPLLCTYLTLPHMSSMVLWVLADTALSCPAAVVDQLATIKAVVETQPMNMHQVVQIIGAVGRLNKEEAERSMSYLASQLSRKDQLTLPALLQEMRALGQTWPDMLAEHINEISNLSASGTSTVRLIVQQIQEEVKKRALDKMKEADKDLLRDNMENLKKNIAPQIAIVLEYLESNGIITDDTKKRIECENKSPGDKATELLYHIRSKGKHAFQTLYDATISAGLFTAADILRPDNAPHQPKSLLHDLPDEESGDETLPDCWPPQDEPGLKQLKKIVKVKSFKDSRMKGKLLKEYNNACSSSQTKYYPLIHKNRGLCLIISNEKFDHLEYRDGTLQDVAGLNNLFSNLGFDCYRLKDLKSEDMKKLIRTKVLERDHSTSNCFVLVILSHGAEGVVFGTDGKFKEDTNEPLNYVEIKWIKQSVCAVPSLHNKPKLFFIQACRGHEHDKGRSVDSSTKTSKGASPAPTEERGKETTDSGGLNTTEIQEGSTTSLAPSLPGAASHSSPTFADLYLSFSTTEGNVSYRNTKFGTWYVQALIWVLSRFAYREDIHGLMTKVASLMSKAEVEQSGFKQICDSGGTLMKTFCFFPNLSKED